MADFLGNPGPPYDECYAITPSDTTALAQVSRCLYVGVGGDVTVDCSLTGTAILFKAVPQGTQLYVMAKKVYATGTTASQIVAMS